MRSASLLALAALAMAAPQAFGQCNRYFIAPPTAPDMKNPGFYYQNCYGVIYGPNYFVRPPFPAYQEALPQSPCDKIGQYAKDPKAFQDAMANYKGFTQPTFPGFPHHPWGRSLRDYFMYDSDPVLSPYNYDYSGTGGVYGGRREGCD